MNTKKAGGVKYVINEQDKTFNDKVYPALPFKIRSKTYRMKVPEQYGNNPSGQLAGLARKVTELVRDERIVLGYNKATEVRNHVERLIVEAMQNGDRHRPTMALANFWLLDKSLIHKLFKELVPRYANYSSAFTALHNLGLDYSIYGRTMTEWKKLGSGALAEKRGQCVLELRQNNLPPITRPQLNRSELLTNVLLKSARESTKQLSGGESIVDKKE
jgi:large subunit ribosomal protein L17